MTGVRHDTLYATQHWGPRHGVGLVGAYHLCHGGLVADLVAVLLQKPGGQGYHMIAPLGTSGAEVRILQGLQLLIQDDQHLPSSLIHISVQPLRRFRLFGQRLAAPVSEHGPISRRVDDLIRGVEDHWTEVGQDLQHWFPLPTFLHHEEWLQLRFDPGLRQVAGGDHTDGALGTSDFALLAYLHDSTQPRNVSQREESYMWPKYALCRHVHKALRKNGADAGAIGIEVGLQFFKDFLGAGNRPCPEHNVGVGDQLCGILRDAVEKTLLHLSIRKANLRIEVLKELRAAGQKLYLHPAMSVAINQSSTDMTAVASRYQCHHATLRGIALAVACSRLQMAA
mmetsp:Transcript_71468/g.157868  ORF Transcript_71468/g.157868 Transcript_71468/m.157868 type:complete len:339 (-) Transcript_71468:54-1070(-)